MSVVRDAAEWILRSRRLVPPDDRKVLLSPPRLLLRFGAFVVARALGRAAREVADDTHARDPALVTLVVDLFRALGRHYFRLEVVGVENVPPGPVLLVGNHSGGLLPSEGFFTAVAIFDRFGPDRGVYALVHDFMFEDPLLRRYAGRLGMLRAGHESARHAFREGACLLVYPGSDMDTFRPFRDRGKVVLAGRKGFLKLALREGVPIVPVVCAGTHEQFVVVARGDRFAHAIKMHVWGRTEVFPVVLAVPWGLSFGFLPYLPLPAQTSLAFGAPMRWPELGPEAADDPASLERCYREVEAKMQSMMDELTAGRRWLVGKRRAP